MPSIILSPMKSKFLLFLLIHGGVTLSASVITQGVFSELGQRSFLLGQLFVWISVISISLPLSLFFFKKNIALIVGISVLKWPILIFGVYRLTGIVKPNMAHLSLGFMPIFLSAILWSFLQKYRD